MTTTTTILLLLLLLLLLNTATNQEPVHSPCTVVIQSLEQCPPVN